MLRREGLYSSHVTEWRRARHLRQLGIRGQDRQVTQRIHGRDGGAERVPARQRIDLNLGVLGSAVNVQDVPGRHQHTPRKLETRPHRAAPLIKDPPEISRHRPSGLRIAGPPWFLVQRTTRPPYIYACRAWREHPLLPRVARCSEVRSRSTCFCTLPVEVGGNASSSIAAGGLVWEQLLAALKACPHGSRRRLLEVRSVGRAMTRAVRSSGRLSSERAGY